MHILLEIQWNKVALNQTCTLKGNVGRVRSLIIAVRLPGSLCEPDSCAERIGNHDIASHMPLTHLWALEYIHYAAAAEGAAEGSGDCQANLGSALRLLDGGGSLPISTVIPQTVVLSRFKFEKNDLTFPPQYLLNKYGPRPRHSGPIRIHPF